MLANDFHHLFLQVSIQRIPPFFTFLFLFSERSLLLLERLEFSIELTDTLLDLGTEPLQRTLFKDWDKVLLTIPTTRDRDTSREGRNRLNL